MLNRREFIRVIALAVAAYPLSSLAESRKQEQLPAKDTFRQKLKDPWLTLAEVQEHLFPAETEAPLISPGAKDIHALDYLRAMMAAPDFDKTKHELIIKGVTWLNELSKQNHSKMFIQLDSETKEKILRRIESSRPGQRWLSVILTYLLEALLTDPVYAGNPDGIGWAWLQHQAGFPRPPEDKKYFNLGYVRIRETKA